MIAVLDWLELHPVTLMGALMLVLAVWVAAFQVMREEDRHVECIEALKDPAVADIVRLRMCTP